VIAFTFRHVGKEAQAFHEDGEISKLFTAFGQPLRIQKAIAGLAPMTRMTAQRPAGICRVITPSPLGGTEFVVPAQRSSRQSSGAAVFGSL
jgi:hypothetical protein